MILKDKHGNEFDLDVVHVVEMEEYERGWGSRVDDVLYFSTEEQAIIFMKEYNEKHNTETYVPDWYIVPRYKGSFPISDFSNIVIEK